MMRWVARFGLASILAGSGIGCDPSAAGDDPAQDGSTSADDGGGPATSSGDASTTSTTGAGGEGSSSGPSDTNHDDPSGGLPDDGNHNCCRAHAEPVCNERLVQSCVCQADASCCVFAWDENCAQVAEAQCGATCMDGGAEETSACEAQAFQLTPADAEYSGDWETTQSQVGEGTVAFIGQPATAGSVIYRPEIPCDDTWYVWVRYFDTGDEDAYFVQVDGQPDAEEAIFEGDCTSSGDGYGWRLLNWRDVGAPGCTYVEDPWSFDWKAGEHEISFSLLEARALGRIILTNSLEFDPEHPSGGG